MLSVAEVSLSFGAKKSIEKPSKKKHTVMLTYIKESFEELKNNVTLPPKSESSNLMVVVAIFSILFALATWGVDTVFSKLIKLYFNQVLN
ncbi:Protein translocase subunit SecE [hydrothermal vent metagenome]|uniref:Protein translocase subunit SecE n=1 Tax=hydrothermal vent metagenome TaxID=652676 RepID=A0A3B0TJ06_9ZZZZ